MNENFVVNLTKNLHITIEEKKKCRALNFTSGWTVDEIISEISKLDGKIFKNLFIFEVQLGKEAESKNILDAARKFCEERPLIINLEQKNENKKKTFYVNENSKEWIDVLDEKEVEKNEDFSSFIRWLEAKKFVDIDAAVIEACKVLNNLDPLTLRFLTTLDLSHESHFGLLLQCAANYSKAQFLSALGTPFGSDERFLDELQSNFIQLVDETENSILKSAIGNENEEVLKYIISYCSHLIRLLPFSHQQKINEDLVDAGKLNILCDLLEFCDFIFPADLETQNLSHERLEKIIEKRQNFHDAIENENYEEIHKFITSSGLKLAKNIQNKTALYTALSARKFEIFYHLKSLGFKSDDCDELLVDLEKDRQMIKAKNDSMKKNLKGSQSGDNMAINFLTARSKIFGNNSSEEHDKIRDWFEAINRIKFGNSLLNTVSQCNRLMIIFDFESDNVERVNLENPDAEGIMYPGQKLVIVGAKHSTEEQEQKIKGVLAHELFHYAMRITFENAEQPYLNEHDKRFSVYQKIVENLRNEFLVVKKDDECDGIISSVFTLYGSKDFHAELIVRPIQILTRYDNDELKVEQLMGRYKPLFDFLENHLIQSMDDLDLRQREAVRSFNSSADLISKFFNKNLDFLVPKEVENLIGKKYVIARSNTPKLLLAHFYSQLRIKDGNLVDTRNIFIDSEKFKSAKNELNELLKESKDLKVFVDSSSGIFKKFPLFQFSNFAFITFSQSQSQELHDVIKYSLEKTEELEKVEINYNWSDFTMGTQNELLIKTKVNFQNNPDMTICELLESPQDIIDAEMLNLIFEDIAISINPNEEVEDHFHQLFRDRNFIWRNQSISLEDLLENTKNEKYVLISDVAGTGKSWVMKNILKEISRLNPKKWLTFLDLKLLIPVFKEQKRQQNFQNFIVNEILYRKPKFEIEIFKQKYKTGNAIFFFDGFDEVGSESSPFVLELMKSFDLNSDDQNELSHNQLWISTRDFFEIELCEKLDATFRCKLAEFTAEDGINLISIIWRLYDLRDDKMVDSKKDLVESVQIENYKRMARDICLRMPTSLDGIGQPLIYKMLAKVTGEKKKIFTDEKFSNYQLFEEFWRISEEDWSHHKGEYRTKTDAESQKFDLNFLKVHQLKAMQKFVPGKLKYCDIEADNAEWTDIDLIGCGLMTKNDENSENYFFIHETFREFFVANFILRILSKPKVDASVYEYIREVVMNPKHEVIRMLLNEGLVAEKMLQGKIDKKAQEVATKAESISNLYVIFTKYLRNLDELGAFWFLVLKHRNYRKIGETLTKNIIDLFEEHGNEITENSLKIFIELFTSGVDISTIEVIIARIAQKTRIEIMPKIINFENKLGENIFFVLVKTKTFTEKMLEKFIKILEEYLSRAEITEKMMKTKCSGESVLHMCILRHNIRNLKTFWTIFEKMLGAENFNKLLMQKSTDLGNTILHLTALKYHSADYHETFWRLLLKTFENEKHELKKFALCGNAHNINFIYRMVQENNLDILNCTLNQLKTTFAVDEVREILGMKCFQNRNLLQHAAQYSKQLKSHKILWSFLIELFPNDIQKFCMESDVNGKDLLHYIVRFSTSEIFNFYIQELEKTISKAEIRKVLCCLNDCGRNLLQEAILNNSLELHKSLFKILLKYFNFSEILKFLSLQDYFGKSLLQYPNLYKSKEIIEFLQAEGMREIKEITEYCTNDLGPIESQRTEIENVLVDMFNRKDLKNLSLNGVNQGITLFENTRDIENIVLNAEKKVHDESCKFLIEKSNEAEIKEILLKEHIFGANFAHQVFMNGNVEVIQQILENIKHITNLKDIFNTTNSNGINLVQYSANKAIDFSVYKYLWKLMKTFFNLDEIFGILEHKDKFGNNFLLHIARFSSENVVELTWKQFEEYLKIDNQKFKTLVNERNLRGDNVLHVCCHLQDSGKLNNFWMEIEKMLNNKSEMKEFVKQTNSEDQRTILHQMAIFCNSVEFHETLWKLLLGAFNDTNELKDFLLNKDNVGDNFLFNLIRSNTRYVIEFTFDILQKTFSQTQFEQLLNSKGSNNCSLAHQVFKYKKDIKIHKILWKYLSSCQNFTDVLTGVDSTGWGLLKVAAKYSTADILNFIYEKFIKLNDKEKVKKIILSGNNFLEIAAACNKDLDFHESLWKLTCSFLDLTEILQLIHGVDDEGLNILQLAVKFNIKDVVELNWIWLKKFLNPIEQANYLRRRTDDGLNIVGIATKYNRPNDVLELVRSLMKTFQNENEKGALNGRQNGKNIIQFFSSKINRLSCKFN